MTSLPPAIALRYNRYPVRRKLRKPRRSSQGAQRAAKQRTEQRNPRARNLDGLPTREIVRLIHREDAQVARAVGRELSAIARAADAIAAALGRGGRLIYVGAGTSGRLAMLDAAECPPTFGVSPRQVLAVIAGGRRALVRAVEGAEDDAVQGARDLASRRVSGRDVVVGIAAGGATPFVLGALRAAKRRKAVTIGLTANRHSPLGRLADILIAPDTGPEIVAGSTRMKAGTAQKMVLNLLSTTAMIRLGRVYGQWMIGVAMTNNKLRRRGLRILQEAAAASPQRAARALREASGDLRVAMIILKRGVAAAEARRRLQDAAGNLRRALGERDA